MNLLLSFVVFSIPWTYLGQAEGQADQTTKLDGHPSQGNSTLNTTDTSIRTNTSSNSKHVTDISISDGMLTTTEMQISSSGVLDGREVDQSSDTNSSEELETTTSSNRSLSGVSNESNDDTDRKSGTTRYFLFTQTPQYEDNITSTSLQSSHISTENIDQKQFTTDSFTEENTTVPRATSPSTISDQTKDSTVNITDSRNTSTATLSALLNRSTHTLHTLSDTSSSFTQSTPVNVDTTSVTFEDFVELTAENLTVCFESKNLHFNAIAGQIMFSHSNHNSSLYEFCSVKFTVPPGMVIQITISINTNSCFSYSGRLASTVPYYFVRPFYCDEELIRLRTYGNTITFVLARNRVNASIDLVFNFTAVPPPEVEVLFITPTTGYVQSPDWDGSTNYPRYMNKWARLDVPSNASVMISFLTMDIEGHVYCGYDRLTLVVQVNRTVNETEELIYCNNKPVLKPTVFHTNELLFHFKSDNSREHLGFKIYFSFHNQSEIPKKLDDGKWDCSVSYYPKFQQHFNCNRVEECSGGEDEGNCGDNSQECDGKDFFAIGSNCYTFISGEKHVTWNEAANECIRREGYLASLNSPKEWEEVMKVAREIMKETVYFGLQTTGPSFPELYRSGFQWTDGSAVFYAKIYKSYFRSSADCSTLTQSSSWYYDADTLVMDSCDQNMTTSFLCEKDVIQNDDSPKKLDEIVMHPLEWRKEDDKYVTCPSGHVTQTFMACDVKSVCWANQIDASTEACDYHVTPPPPSMECMNGVDHVPYTLVCDHRPDCSDNSDENFCVFPSCRVLGKFQCSNKQCVAHDLRCDDILHCLDGSDERQCPLWYSKIDVNTPNPPALVEFDGYGSYMVKPVEIHSNQTNSICPETHFLCPGNLTYCMPVFVRCNGVYDCPGREDEEGCDRYQCPGFYRCRASQICIHANHTCDGVFHCPQRDDELLCDATCPQNCTCQGLAFYCQGHFPAGKYRELRFLHAPGSGLTLESFAINYLMVYLNLAKCNLKNISNIVFPNLRILDLSDNEITSLSTTQMNNMNNLQKLSLSGNPINFPFAIGRDLQFPSLQTLDLSKIIVSQLDVTALMVFPKLVFLNLTDCGIERISGEGFHSLPFLRYLDLRSCPMTDFPTNIFKGLRGLREVWADNYKLCCEETLPQGFSLTNCHSPADEISSCDALLRSDFYRIILSVFAALALIGNLGSFVYRVLINRVSSNLGFGVFVTHLCISDFLMGLYLAVIGVADRIYQGNYLWNDDIWKRSAGCKLAGFLSLLSSEVSAFIICLITFDRFLVLHFPFSNMHFKKKSAHVACMIVWLIGIMLAGIPLLPVTAHWNFYSQNGICIPLPITRNDFPGHDYSFIVIIVVNFILFLLIAAGQVFIFWSIRTNSMAAGDSNKKSNDLAIARRLITIAMSDFLCWFPIGLLGLLASSGVPIDGEVNIAIAIIILPVNSAINPFLYTINMLLERRRKAQEKRIQKMIMSTFASKYSETVVDRLDDGYTKSEALNMIRNWLSQNLLSSENLKKVILDAEEKQKALESQAT